MSDTHAWQFCDKLCLVCAQCTSSAVKRALSLLWRQEGLAVFDRPGLTWFCECDTAERKLGMANRIARILTTYPHVRREWAQRMVNMMFNDLCEWADKQRAFDENALRMHRASVASAMLAALIEEHGVAPYHHDVVADDVVNVGDEQ